MRAHFVTHDHESATPPTHKESNMPTTTHQRTADANHTPDRRRSAWEIAPHQRRMGWPDCRENKTERRMDMGGRRIGITNDRRRQERRTYVAGRGVGRGYARRMGDIDRRHQERRTYRTTQGVAT